MENFDVVTETPSVAVVRSLLNPNIQCPTDNLFSGLDSASAMHRSPSRSSSRGSHHSRHSRASRTSHRSQTWDRAPQEIPRREHEGDHEESRAPSRTSYHSHSLREPERRDTPTRDLCARPHEEAPRSGERARTPDHESRGRDREPREETRRSSHRDPDSTAERARRRALYERAELNQWEFENHPEDAQERQFRDSCGAATMLSGEDIMRSKHMVLMELRDIELDGAELTQKYTLDSDFDEMHCELLRQRRYMDCRHRVASWTMYIKVGAFLLEIVNIYAKWYAWSPLNLEGFGIHMLSNTGDLFQLPLKRCYYKYVKRVSDSPAWDLGVAIAMSIAIFHFKGQMPQWMEWVAGMAGSPQAATTGASRGPDSPGAPTSSNSMGMGGLFQAGMSMLGPMFSQFAQATSAATSGAPAAPSAGSPATALPGGHTASNAPTRAPFGITLPPPPPQ